MEDFLERIPPATTPVGNEVHWIWVANPYGKASRGLDRGESQEALNAEGPNDEEMDLDRFRVLGRRTLEELKSIRLHTEMRRVGDTKATTQKANNFQRDMIVRKLLDTAVECHVASGKVS